VMPPVESMEVRESTLHSQPSGDMCRVFPMLATRLFSRRGTNYPCLSGSTAARWFKYQRMLLRGRYLQRSQVRVNLKISTEALVDGPFVRIAKNFPVELSGFPISVFLAPGYGKLRAQCGQGGIELQTTEPLSSWAVGLKRAGQRW
jgi:hypothetical protein